MLIKAFQFLIGRLAVLQLPAAAPRLVVFQFLIGRLAVRFCFLGSDAMDVFQFLIGRLAVLELQAKLLQML